ncbi:tumor necrosis factor receptor superfamily member 1A-like [Terrapene carolina triunguis]|uniref:tumor necrosis factor receptor superfamily member 1A-like n=1 Tax=Terrapene triunguis TaxID=2587831 RepID=UPI000E775865|nr:tumor necrosis factor receptor superfamily member 1A-like [Terrapene carolina triunguis]
MLGPEAAASSVSRLRGFLAALLLTGSGFPLLGTPKPRAAGTGSEPRRARSPADSALGLHHHQRHQRHVARNNCAPDDPLYSPKRCCQKCPAGKFMTAPCTSRGNDTACKSCPPGTYLSFQNLERECRKCSECQAQASQLVLKNCTETSDIECGCGAGHFMQCTDPACRDFTCQECRRCKGRATLKNWLSGCTAADWQRVPVVGHPEATSGRDRQRAQEGEEPG